MYTEASRKNPDGFWGKMDVETSRLDCRHCGEHLHGKASALGARCPLCREPLYERRDADRRRRETLDSRGSVCAVHPGNVAVGPCKRCGTFMCGICRTRWEDRVLCLACIERLMGNKEKSPEHLKTHRWQAGVSVLLGAAGWILALPLAAVPGAGSSGEVLIPLLMLAVFSLAPSLFGLGLAAAALRVRGNRMVLATCGLALTGAQIGTVTGLTLLVMWKQ